MSKYLNDHPDDDRKTVTEDCPTCGNEDAGLMRYEVCILPKPENTSSYCAAFYKITATSQNQAFEHGKETFIRGFANCGVTAENFDAEYDIGVTRGEKIE